MNIREKIENNLTIFFLGTVITSFVAAFTVFQALLSLTNSEIVSKDSYILIKNFDKKYIEKSEYDKVKTELDNIKGAIILEATWVQEDKPMKILYDQITIEIKNISDTSALCKLTIPSQSVVNKFISKGESSEFSYKSDKYSINLLDIIKDESFYALHYKTRISVNKIL